MAALATATVRVDGTVLKITREMGDFLPDDARSESDRIDWDYDEVKVLTDEADATHVRFDRVQGKPSPILPSRGDRVSIVAEVRAARGKVKVTAKSVDAGTYEDCNGTAVPLTLGGAALASV